MDGTLVFLGFGVVAVMGVLVLHCRSFSRTSCNAVLRGALNKAE
jgi:hypothetical protein